jgi:hypothetical protein
MYPPSSEKDFPEIEQLGLKGPDRISEVLIELPSRQERRKRRFLPSLSLALFCQLIHLPGKALAVYLIVLQRSRMKGKNPVMLSSAYLKQFGLMRWDKSRALATLEKAGLVRIEKRGRKNPLVHLVKESGYEPKQQ